MKYIIGLLAGVLLAFYGLSAKKNKIKSGPTCSAKTSFYNLSAKNIDDKIIKMSDYKGKYILVVNTASKCRYTYQYEDLEKLYSKYKKDLVVLGFPSNQFWKQEPGNDKDIKSFCSAKYQITFPLFKKSDVKGKNMNDIYRWLTDPKLNGWNEKDPTWNFNKYLIDRSGNLIKYFSSDVKPLDKRITSLIK